MYYFLSKTAIWLIVFFILPIAFICVRPYDDHAVRELLTPTDGCPAPCFMGIRPGQTTAEDALIILENHPWVAEVEGAESGLFRKIIAIPSDTVPAVHWKWSGRQPGWLARSRDGELRLANGRVHHVDAYTSLLMGDLLLALGEPDIYRIASYTSTFRRFWSYDGWYDDQGLWVTTVGLCPARQFYTGRMLIRFQNEPPDFSGPNTSDFSC